MVPASTIKARFISLLKSAYRSILDEMKPSMKTLYYSATAVSCAIMIVCVLLLPSEVISSGLSLLPDDVSTAGWRTLKWLGMVDHIEYLAHGLIFAVLILVALLAWEERASSMAVAFGVFTLGGVIELLQVLVPDHSPEAGDLLANLVGVALGWTAKVGLFKLASAASLAYRPCSRKVRAHTGLQIARRNRLPR